MQRNLSASEKRAYERWLELRASIRRATPIPINESEKDKNVRKKKLINSFPEFCKFYFPNFFSAPFGWFHIAAANAITNDPNIFAVLEFPREHAKSVLSDVFIPMWLIARGELTGMILASSNFDKAKGLLGDLQAQLMENQRFINDYGKMYNVGDWQEGHFVTSEGIGFWAFGRGQSPRGAREAEKRPNLCVIDDIDDEVIVRNEDRVSDAVEWVLGALYGCLSIKGGRTIVAGNRIHEKSILAHLVGDVEEGQTAKEDIFHLKVYATEKGKNHEKADINDPEAVPAWKENYTIEQLRLKMSRMGYRIAQREYYHLHIKEGKTFKRDNLVWAKMFPLRSYKKLVTYCDPSFKDGGDYKAIVFMGYKSGFYDIIDCWLRQASVLEMVTWHLLLCWALYENGFNVTHLYEATFSQDEHTKVYKKVAKKAKKPNLVKEDKTKKPDKKGRIETTLSPLVEQRVLRFNEDKKNSPDMKQLIDQFCDFPKGFDDGPDATTEAVKILSKYENRDGNAPTNRTRTGNFEKSEARKFN